MSSTRDHDGAGRRECLDPAAERPSDRVGRGLAGRGPRLCIRVQLETQQSAERGEDIAQTGAEQGTEARPCPRAGGDLRLGIADREPAPEHLLERPDGESAVREALTLEPRGALPDGRPKLLEQARLTDARLADEEHDLALPGREVIGGAAQAVQLAVASDERRRLRRALVGEQGARELARGDASLTAAYGELAERLEAEAMREAPGRFLADRDRAGRGNRLQARGNVGRVPEGDGLVIHRTDDSHRGRAGVDADADVEALDPPGLLDVARVLPYDLHDPQRRAGGSLGVVFVGRRHAEVRADAVAHVRLNRPSVLVDRATHLIHALADQRLRLLRRQLLGQRRRSDDVGEQHRHGPNLVVMRHGQRPCIRQVRSDPSCPSMRTSLDGHPGIGHAGAGRRRRCGPSRTT